MSSRARPSSGASGAYPNVGTLSGQPRRSETDLPPYKKPSHPLTTQGATRLSALQQATTLRDLKKHNKKAQEAIQHVPGALYDKLHEYQEHIARQQKHWDAGKRLDSRVKEEGSFEQYGGHVEDAVTRLEEGMRAVIDNEAAIERTEEGLRWLRENAAGAMSRERNTQQSQRDSDTQIPQSQRRRTQTREGEDDEEAESSPGPTLPSQARERIALAGPSEMLSNRLQSKKDQYFTTSHSTRYASHNDYIGFKRLVHDAKYGDSGPALGDATTWFTDSGLPAPGVTASGAAADSDEDDLVMEKAKISTKCPLTLREFQDPVTSAKCPHTFERHAIMEYVKQTMRNNRERHADCPVAGCSQQLTPSDIRPDPVVIRRIRRIQQAASRAHDDGSGSDEEGTGGPHHQSQTIIDSDDGMDEIVESTPAMRIKRSESQMLPRSSNIVDLGDEEGDDE